MWAGLLDLLFPPRCAGCGARGDPFCTECQDRLPWILPPVCPRCGRPYLRFSAQPLNRVPADTLWAESVPSFLWCPPCRRNPPGFAIARSLAAYEGALREAICAMKFRRQKVVAAPLGRLLARFAPQEILPGVQAVVPVPLHPDRLAARGFNQAELLARPVAEAIGVPCFSDALRRVRQEAAQADLGGADRWHNVEEAFAPSVPVRGTVLLVDDVFSTGATAAACARALVEAGAERVVVLTLARAILRRYPREAPVSNYGSRISSSPPWSPRQAVDRWGER